MAAMASNKASVIFLLCLFFGINCVWTKVKTIALAEDDWQDMLQGEWMVEFYAPWCPACKVLQPVWDDFSNWSQDLGIKVAKVDVTTAPGLSGRFMVTALPTIYHVLNGDFRQYRGGRDKDSLISFIEEKKWKDIEAIPSWKAPSSFVMSIVSYFFKLSTVLRSFHNNMVEEFGIPTWGSYVVIGFGTILIGAVLGLILVCVIDCMFPPKTQRPSPLAPVQEGGEDELGQDMEDLLDEGAESANESQDTQSEPEDDYDDSQADDVSQEEEEHNEESSPKMRKRKSRKAD